MPNRQYLRRARRTPRNFARMLLPHERDESTDPNRAEQPPQEAMQQAQKDIAEGQQDTDCRSQPPSAGNSACANDENDTEANRRNP